MRCNKCNVNILDGRRSCPLCQESLCGTPSEGGFFFPVIPYRVKISRLFLNIISLLSIAAAVISVAINMSISGARAWSLFVVAGIACLWLSAIVVIRKMGNIPKATFLQVLLMSVAAVLWDLCTGFHRWSLDYAVPILCMCSMVSMAAIARIMKLNIGDYLIYLVLDILIGAVSITFILCGVLTVVLPSALCAAGSVIMLAALLLFNGKSFISELHRRMHV